ncbi:hypothetical protein C2W62_26165 [Candidatus Entotheonella serta]|nr:hypothetical protein C2W62_26165 [Candidatus Entotheonella serta]
MSDAFNTLFNKKKEDDTLSNRDAFIAAKNDYIFNNPGDDSRWLEILHATVQRDGNGYLSSDYQSHNRGLFG